MCRGLARKLNVEQNGGPVFGRHFRRRRRLLFAFRESLMLDSTRGLLLLPLTLGHNLSLLGLAAERRLPSALRHFQLLRLTQVQLFLKY